MRWHAQLGWWQRLLQPARHEQRLQLAAVKSTLQSQIPLVAGLEQPPLPRQQWSVAQPASQQLPLILNEMAESCFELLASAW